MTPVAVFLEIMLVDDDCVMNRLHRRLIEQVGLTGKLTKALDGMQALAVLRAALTEGRRLPDVIFIDINMPRGGGFVFLEGYAMLTLARNVPQVVAMLSSALLPDERERAIRDQNVAASCARPMSVDWLRDFARRHAATNPAGARRYS